MGLYGSLTVFADLSIVFPFGLSRSFTVFPKTVWPSATHKDYMETRLKFDIEDGVKLVAIVAMSDFTKGYLIKQKIIPNNI